jgi:hypothetical protein
MTNPAPVPGSQVEWKVESKVESKAESKVESGLSRPHVGTKSEPSRKRVEAHDEAQDAHVQWTEIESALPAARTPEARTSGDAA